MDLKIQITVPEVAKELGWKLPEVIGIRVGVLNELVFITVKSASSNFDVDATSRVSWEPGKAIEHSVNILVWGSNGWEIEKENAGYIEIEIKGEEVNKEGIVLSQMNSDEADVIFVPYRLILKTIKFQETKVDEKGKKIWWNWT